MENIEQYKKRPKIDLNRLDWHLQNLPEDYLEAVEKIPKAKKEVEEIKLELKSTKAQLRLDIQEKYNTEKAIDLKAKRPTVDTITALIDSNSQVIELEKKLIEANFILSNLTNEKDYLNVYHQCIENEITLMGQQYWGMQGLSKNRIDAVQS